MAEWLIRKIQNDISRKTISRPYSDQEILQILGSAELSPHDELCPSLGYWFTLRDPVAVKQYFSNATIRLKGGFDDETTVTAITLSAIKIKTDFDMEDSPMPDWTNGLVIFLIALTLLLLGMILYWLRAH